MDIRQSQKLSQRLTLTPQMRQSLRMLELPLLDLKNYLEIQIEENPALGCDDAPGEDLLFNEKIEKLIEQDKSFTDFPINQAQEETDKKQDYKKSLISKPPTLEEHLLRQLRTFPLDKKAYKIGEHILTNLDENGYLNPSPEEILVHFNKGVSADEKITRKDIESILQLIYNFDPPGIGAGNLKECLLIQLRLKNKEKSLAYKIVSLYLSELMKSKSKLIAKKLKISFETIKKAVVNIAVLNPKPGKAFESTTTQILAPTLPDIIIDKIDGKLQVIVNTRFLPRLRVNSYYLNLLKSKKISPKTKKYIQEKISAALGIIKSLSQREETVQKIVSNIVKVQKDFFEQGDKSLIKPLTHKNIAKLVQRNESTVSRVVNSKYVQTSYGIFRLNYFFSKSLKTPKGESISQEYVKHRLLDIITESEGKNLRDGEIVKLLKDQDIKIARRTVAKYRKELKIPAYYQRKNKK